MFGYDATSTVVPAPLPIEPLDGTRGFTSADMDDFNHFLDTFMQGGGPTDCSSDAPTFLPVDLISTPVVGATNEEFAQFQQRQEQLQSAFMAGDAVGPNMFQSSQPFPAQGFLQLGSLPSNHSSGSSQAPDAERLSSGMVGNSSESSGPLTAEQKNDARKTKVLEKNRRAQKRFRDKQKNKMSDMETQLQALQRSLEQVTLEKTTYMRQNEVLNKVLELRQSQINVLTETARIAESEEELELKRQTDSVAADMMLRCRFPGAVTRFSCVEDIRGLSGKDAVLTWRQLVERIAAALTAADVSEASQDAATQLQHLTDEAIWFAQTLTIVNPLAIKILVMTNQETLLPDEGRSKDQEFWSEAASKLDLNPDQREKIQYLARNLKTAITRSGVERQALASELQGLLPSTCGPEGNLAACIRSNDLIALLRKNFQAEHEAWCTFTATILAKILSSRQFARYTVGCFPLFPNALRLAKYVFATGATPADIDHFHGGCDRPVIAPTFTPKCEPNA